MSVEHSLAPLFLEAELRELWFYSPYHQLWFTPAELRAAQREGRFRFDASNWVLRSPDEFVEEKRQTLSVAERDFEAAVLRVAASRRRLVTK